MKAASQSPDQVLFMSIYPSGKRANYVVDLTSFHRIKRKKIVTLNRVGGRRSGFPPTFVFRPLSTSLPYVPFGIPQEALLLNRIRILVVSLRHAFPLAVHLHQQQVIGKVDAAAPFLL